MSAISSGVYPVMLTPFHKDGSVDYQGYKNYAQWLIDKQVQGLFAVCGSSEMTQLTLDERVSLAGLAVQISNGRIPVVASGHISSTLDQQIEEINAIAQTGIDAFVLVSGTVVRQDQDSDAFKRNIQAIVTGTGDIPLGIYECPSPYNRQLTPDEMAFMAETKRFVFMKDTSCNQAIDAKIQAVKGTDFQVFNACTATLLDSLRAGGSGFSGIMANYHPDLYVKLWQLWRRGDEEKAKQLQAMLFVLGDTSLPYNVGTKYYLSHFEGVEMGGYSRVCDQSVLTPQTKARIADFYQATQVIRGLA